jgi:hypothetical protein
MVFYKRDKKASEKERIQKKRSKRNIMKENEWIEWEGELRGNKYRGLILSCLWSTSEQARAIQINGTIDGKVILILPKSQNFVLSSLSYHSWEKYFV